MMNNKVTVTNAASYVSYDMAGAELGVGYTNTRTYHRAINRNIPLPPVINDSETRAEKDSKVANYIATLASSAIPMQPVLWFGSEICIKSGVGFFLKAATESDPLYASYSALIGAWERAKNKADDQPTAAEKQAYKKMVLEFRKLPEFTDREGMMSLRGNVTTRLGVAPAQFATLNEMIKDMNKKAYNTADRRTTERRDHWKLYEDLLDDPVNGIPMGSLTQRNKSGKLLISTAILGYIGEKEITMDVLKARINAGQNVHDDTVNGILTDAIAEAENIIKDQVKTENQAAQSAATDIVFNAYFWLTFMATGGTFKVAGGETLNINFALVNKSLAATFSRPKGKNGFLNKIKESFYKPLTAFPAQFAKTQENMMNKYLAPWVPTVGRMADMALVFGSYVPRMPTFQSYNVSVRSLVNYRVEVEGLGHILALFALEKAAKPDWDKQEEILQSEFALHQILLGKRSPFDYAGERTGNALNVAFEVQRPQV